jgi:transketolase
MAMRDALLTRLHEAMAHDSHLFFTCADFGSPILDKIRRDYPERFINVGIAEQNLINVSAGLALEGYTVFAYAIAPFITMRCYEQIRVNLALLSEVRPMNVNLIGVGAGYSYVVSGPTHQCYEDLSIIRALPNMGLLSPSDHVAAASMFDHCVSNQHPKYLRLDAQVLPVLYADTDIDLSVGFSCLRDAGETCILATGYAVHTALKAADQLAAEGVSIAVIDLFNIAGFSSEALLQTLSRYHSVVTLEEGFKGRGGVDSLIFDLLANHGVLKPVLNLGVEGRYRFDLGSRQQLHEEAGIGVDVVTQRVRDVINRSNSQARA